MIFTERPFGLSVFSVAALLVCSGVGRAGDLERPGAVLPRTVRGQVGSPFAAAPAKKPGFSESLKGGFDKMTGVFSQKKENTPAPTANDELSLANRAKPSPKLHTSLARMYEAQGRLKDAEGEYREALKLDPNSSLALLEYARFLDRQEQFDAAIGLYRHAEKLHRKDPAVHNDLGLCLARHGRSQPAVAAFREAVALAPNNSLYRNNLAMVLVDLERYDEAMEHLVAVNGRGVAEYNMGYLLFKKGRGDLALRHFTAAAEHNPHMTQAQWWVARLNEREPGVSSPAQFAGTPGRATEPESVAPTRRPTYTASSERPQRAPMVWVESTDPAHGAPPNRNGVPGCERIPPLRQPENVVPVQRTPYGAFGGRPQEWAPSAPPTKRSLEPLPTIRR